MTFIQDAFTSWHLMMIAKTFCLMWGPELGRQSSSSSGKAVDLCVSQKLLFALVQLGI